MKIQTQLILWHRYLGIASCLFFAMWFSSGIVMMYVEMPRLAPEERVAALPPLDAGRIAISPQEAVAPDEQDGGDAKQLTGRAGYEPGRAPAIDSAGGGFFLECFTEHFPSMWCWLRSAADVLMAVSISILSWGDCIRAGLDSI